MGQQVFFAVEETDCCTRNCCGALRGFEMIIAGEKKYGDLDVGEFMLVTIFGRSNFDIGYNFGYDFGCWCPTIMFKDR